MALGEYIGAGSGVTKGLYHLNGNANDSSGNGLNGTATNITWSNGKIGSGAASVSGTGYIQLPAAFHSLNGTTITASFWIKPTNFTADQIVCGEDNNTSAINRIGYRITSGKVNYVYCNALTGNFDHTSTGALSTTSYTNVIVTRNGTASRIYLNGQLDSTYTFSNIYSGSNGNKLFSNTAGNLKCSCQADEFIFENRVWTAEEIRRYYTFSKGRFAIL